MEEGLNVVEGLDDPNCSEGIILGDVVSGHRDGPNEGKLEGDTLGARENGLDVIRGTSGNKKKLAKNY